MSENLYLALLLGCLVQLEGSAETDIGADFSKYEDVFSKDELVVLRTIFTELDTHGRGTLNLEDFKPFMEMQGGGLSMEEVLEKWHTIDVDGDGSITPEEFLDWMARSRKEGVATESRRSSMDEPQQPSMWDSIGLQDSSVLESAPEVHSHRRKRSEIPDLSGGDLVVDHSNDSDEEDEDEEEEEEEEEDEDGTNQQLLAQKREQALKNDLGRALDMLEHERKRRADIEEELEGMYSREDQEDAAGSVPKAEYERLKLEQERAREQLELMEDMIAESRMREEEFRSEMHAGDRSPRSPRASMPFGQHLQSMKSMKSSRTSRTFRSSRHSRPSMHAYGAQSSMHAASMQFGTHSSVGVSIPPSHRFSHSSSGSRGSDYVLYDHARSSSPPRHHHHGSQIIEEEESEKSEDSDGSEEWVGFQENAPGRCRGDIFSFARTKTVVEDKYREERKKMVTQINTILGDVSSNQQKHEKHAKDIAEDIVTLLKAEPASLAPARAVAERAAILIVQHQQEVLANRNCSLGAQLDLADVRDNLCGGLEDNIQDARMALVTLKKTLGESCSAADEQSKLCERLASHAQLLRSAALAVENTGALDIHAESVLAESVSEAVQTQLAEIHAESAKAAEVLAAMHAEEVAKAEAADDSSDEKEDPAELEKQLVDEVMKLSAQVDHLAQGLACPIVVETVDSDSGSGSDQATEADASEDVVQVETTPARSFAGFWNAISHRDADIKFKLQASMRRGEAWIQANGIKSPMDVILAMKQEMFVDALYLDPTRRKRALNWFEQKAKDAKEQIAHDRLAVACLHRKCEELESALELGRATLAPQDSLLQQAARIWEESRREDLDEKVKLLDEAFVASVPEKFADIISHVVILPTESEQCVEVSHLREQESRSSWVTCLAEPWAQKTGLGKYADRELSDSSRRILHALEGKITEARSELHVTLAFVTRSHLDTELLVKVSSELQEILSSEHDIEGHIGLCCFDDVWECKQYLDEQEKEQRRLRDILGRVEALRSEVASWSSQVVNRGLSNDDVLAREEVLKQLATEIRSIGTTRTLVELSMRNRQEKLLETQHVRLTKENARLQESLSSEKAALEAAVASCGTQWAPPETRHKVALLRQCLTRSEERRADLDKLEASSSQLLGVMQVKNVDAVENREAFTRSIRSLVGSRPPQSKNDVCYETHWVPTLASTTEEICSAALERMHTRVTKFSSLRWAGVRLQASLQTEVTEDTHGEMLDRLKDALADFLATHLVDVFDVSTNLRKNSLSCELRLGHFVGESSEFKHAPTVMMAVEALQRELWSGVLREFWESVDAYDVYVEPIWPLNRIQAELDLEHGYALSRHHLRRILPMLSQSQRSYHLAWNAILSKSPKAVEALLQTESMARFGERGCKDTGRLLLASEGAEQGLVQVECRQGVATLPELLADAAEAQRQLKEALAPGTAWAKAELNDISSVPLGHPLRSHDCSSGSAQGGLMVVGATLYDPGTKPAGKVLRKAATQRKRFQAFDVQEARCAPALDSVLDVSRLGIIFDSARGLVMAAEWVLQNFDTIWLNNAFPTPSCLGQRGMNIGVRWVVAAGNSLRRDHVCELELSLRELYEVQHSDGHHVREDIRSLLQSIGVQRGDLDSVQDLILQLLDYTDGRAARENLKDLRHTMRKVEVLKASASDHLNFLIRELIAESTLQAMAVGVPVDQIRAEAADARSLVDGAGHDPEEVSRARKSRPITNVINKPGDSTVNGPNLQNSPELRQAASVGVDANASAPETTTETSINQLSQDRLYEDSKAFSNELQDLHATIADMQAKAESTEELRDALLHAVSHHKSPPWSTPMPPSTTPEDASRDGIEKKSQDVRRSQRWSRWERAAAQPRHEPLILPRAGQDVAVKIEAKGRARPEEIACREGVEDMWQEAQEGADDIVEVWDLMRRLKLQSKDIESADAFQQPSRSRDESPKVQFKRPLKEQQPSPRPGVWKAKSTGRRKLKLPLLSPEQLQERERQEARLQQIIEDLSKRLGSP